jgi:hypothetical protein
MWQQRIVIGRRGIQRQDFAVRRHLHMFHLAFSTGGEHASAAFHSIARAQSRGFEPRWPSIEDEVEPSLRARAHPRRNRERAYRPRRLAGIEGGHY